MNEMVDRAKLRNLASGAGTSDPLQVLARVALELLDRTEAPGKAAAGVMPLELAKDVVASNPRYWQQRIGQWHGVKYPAPETTLGDLGNKLAEECGEVCRAIDRMHYAGTGESHKFVEARNNLWHEIGDVGNVLLAICERVAFDYAQVQSEAVARVTADAENVQSQS